MKKYLIKMKFVKKNDNNYNINNINNKIYIYIYIEYLLVYYILLIFMYSNYDIESQVIIFKFRNFYYIVIIKFLYNFINNGYSNIFIS